MSEAQALFGSWFLTLFIIFTISVFLTFCLWLIAPDQFYETEIEPPPPPPMPPRSKLRNEHRIIITINNSGECHVSK